MKGLAIATIILAVGVAGCGSSTPNSPSTFKVFTVQLFPSNEVPPVTNAESSGRGTAVVTVHSDTNTVDFAISLTGSPNNTTLTAAHIHPGSAGNNGGALIGVPGVSGTVLANGSTTFTANGVSAQTANNSAATNVANILAAPQNFYFNVHTTVNGGGVARGQLQ
jgi:CHRD domain